jgi:hypothetical protein
MVIEDSKAAITPEMVFQEMQGTPSCQQPTKRRDTSDSISFIL